MTAAEQALDAVRVLIADDDPDIRTMLRMQFKYDPRFEVAGEAFDGQDAVDSCTALDPDLIVLDLRMPTMDGISAVPLLRDRCPRTKVAVYTASGSAADERSLEANGVVMFSKNVPVRWLTDQLYEFAHLEE